MKTTAAFFEGKLVPIAEAKVSIMTHAFNYGTGCFGGIRAYWNESEEQLFLFRPLEHYQRFLASTRLLMMDLPYTAEQLVAITAELLRREGYRTDAYIRPIAYKVDPIIQVRLHNMHDDVAIFSLPFDNYLPKADGVAVGTSSWRRVDDTAIPARGKVTGAYVNSALIKSEAQLNGFDEAIVLNQDGHLSEGSAENIFILRNGALITPAVHSNILEGITRRTLIELARDVLGLEVVEREIDRTELYVCDEAFFCGTGVQIVAITSVDHRPIGNGLMGPLTQNIRELYFDVVRGRHPGYRHWNTPVYAAEKVAA